MASRYLGFILTIIALELLWLVAGGAAPPVAAQGPVAIPVVITGVRLEPGAGALKIESDRPLQVESVRYTPADRPGE
jgi:hypothetical protein